MSLKELVESAKDSAAEIGDTMTDPNDDWYPVLLIEDRKGGRVVVEIPPEAFASEAAKDALAVALANIAHEVGANAAVLILSAWRAVVSAEDLTRAGETEVTLLDSAREVVVVAALDRITAISWIAPILRSPSAPPRLGEWQCEPGGEGRFITPLRRAMALWG